MRKVVETIFSARPSVSNWCRMCRTLAEYVFAAIQLADAHMHENELFRKAIGYLSLPPKRKQVDCLLDDHEWQKVHHYSASEQRSMNAAVSMLDSKLCDWAIQMQGDEIEYYLGSANVPFARSVLKIRSEVFKERVTVFYAGCCKFRKMLFTALAHEMPYPPIMPDVELDCQSILKDRNDEYQAQSLDLQKRIAAGVEMIASDTMSEGESRRRCGRAGEMAQEDEVVRRVRANGGKGLRGFVSQVLRESVWQLPDGHLNTDAGRQRCYNRVYALLHPFRRRGGRG